MFKSYRTIPFALALLSLLSACATRSVAADTKSLSDYVKVSWRTDSGLPQDSVKKVLQTRDGYVWVGTQEGLARFDGVHFTVFNTQDSPGLESDNIHDLAEDGEGNLWIFANSGLSRYRDGVIKNFTPGQEKSGDRVNSIWIGRDKHLYVASDDLFYRYDNGKLNVLFSSKDYFQQNCWAQFDVPGGDVWGLTGTHKVYQFHDGKAIDRSFKPKGDGIGSLAADGAGRVWAAGSEMYYFANGRFVPYEHPADFQSHAIEWFTLDAAGTLWCLAGNTIYSLLNDRWVPRHTVPGLSTHPHRLAVDASGNPCLWIQGDGWDTLTQYTNGVFRSVDVPERLPVEWAIPVLQDARGDVWVGTKSGLVLLKNPSAHTYGAESGLPQSPISTVAQDQRGTMWIGTDNDGLGSLVNGRYVPSTVPQFRTGPILSICPDDGGVLWVSTRDTLYRYDGKQAAPLVHISVLPTDVVRNALCRDSAGNVWFAQNNDLYRFRGAVMTAHYTQSNGFNADGVCLALTPDRAGGVWIGTLKGCTHFDGHRFIRYDSNNGLPTVPVIAIHEDVHGEVWLGTWGGGLFRWKNGKITGITSREGLYANSIHQIVEDSHGYLWIGSAKGIFRVNRDTLDAVANGVMTPINYDTYGRDEGAEGGQCHGGTQPSACVGVDGTLWFATLGGVVRVFPAQTKAWTVPLIIEQASIGKTAVQPTAPIVAKPGQGDIDLEYTALDYESPQKIDFQYRLSGFNKDWIDAGPRRSAYYTNLPPGTYQFIVRARNGNGVWNPAQPELRITVEPHFYQTLWFKSVCAVALVLIVLMVYTVRVRQLQAHNRYLEAKVAERTEELTDANEELQALHEELIAQNESLQSIQVALEAQNEELTNVKAQLENRNEDLAVANDRLESLVTLDGLTGLKNHRAFQEYLEQQWAHAQRHGTALSLILMDVDRFKQYNDNFGHPAGDDVLKTVGRILMDCARTDDFVARYGGEEFVIVLPDTDDAAAKIVGERFRAGIESAEWPMRPVTASFGIASLDPAIDDRTVLIAEADRALYASKESGRNRVTHIVDIHARLAA